MFISQYCVTREFGGYEEGGWYYDNYALMKTACVITEDYDKALEEAEDLWGNDDMYRVFLEEEQGYFETTEEPYYE